MGSAGNGLGVRIQLVDMGYFGSTELIEEHIGILISFIIHLQLIYWNTPIFVCATSATTLVALIQHICFWERWRII